MWARSLTGRCAVWPTRCAAGSISRSPSPASGKLLVIGGGPAGCESALRLAQRGYDVTLRERSGALGGQLRLAGACPAKGEFNTLIRFYEHRLAELGVHVELNCAADARSVKAAGFRRVIIAAGGAANPPVFENAVTAEDILTGSVIPGKHVVIVGGSFKGVETARYIARASALSPGGALFPHHGEGRNAGDRRRHGQCLQS